jgi:UDP-glucose 4-epimerase
MILYFHSDAIRTEEAARKEIARMTVLAQESGAYGIHKFLYLSSLEVYGNEQGSDENENAACNPVSLAGKTMLACENLLMSFRNEEQLLKFLIYDRRVTIE